MADTHPYTTVQGGLVQTITQFRQSFPTTVDSGTLKRLGFAPNNESYIINVLRFLGLIDDEGKKTGDATKVFSLHDDAEFAKAFGARVKASYKDIFDLHQDAAWSLDVDTLISFFRAADGTSAIVGKRQASTFQLLAAFSGHGDVPEAKTRGKKSTGNKTTVKAGSSKESQAAKAPKKEKAPPPPEAPAPPVGLTVRVEVNLPADGNQATYDRIFKSIRENLLNG